MTDRIPIIITRTDGTETHGTARARGATIDDYRTNSGIEIRLRPGDSVAVAIRVGVVLPGHDTDGPEAVLTVPVDVAGTLGRITDTQEPEPPSSGDVSGPELGAAIEDEDGGT